MSTAKEQNKEVARLLYEESAFRLDKLLWLASALADGSGRFQELDDMFSYTEKNKLAEIFDLPISADADECFDDICDLAELLNTHEKWGFLAEVHIAQKKFSADGTGCSFSMGCCYVKYAYAESPEELVIKAQALEKEMEERDRAKATKE